MFFNRTKANDRQPHLIELFADAIRGVVSDPELLETMVDPNTASLDL